MADAMINNPRTHIALFFTLALYLLTCNMAIAEIFRDPTRPPNMQSIISDKETEVTKSGPRLQAIIISENRRSAIISNRSFNIGDNIGGAKIIRINESEVVLRTGDRLQTLKIFPASSKRAIASDRQTMR